MTAKDKGVKNALLGFVPLHVSAGAVLNVYDLISRRKRFDPVQIGSSEEEKEGAVRSEAGHKKGAWEGFIEDQLSRRAEAFGKSNVAYAGCEVIAVYNALRYIYGRETMSFPDLIGIFRRSGMALGGRWGTSPKAVYRFMKAKGLDPGFAVNVKEFDGLMNGHNCGILSYYNDGRNIMRGVHTVCLTRDEDGRLIAHNVTEDGRVRGPYETVSDMLADTPSRRARGLCLTTVGKRLDQ